MLLGAGFSRALYDPSPLTDSLGEAVRARLPPAEASKMPSSAFIDGRFEEWLSYLSEPQPHFSPDEAASAYALALRVTRAICEVLAEVQSDGLAANTVDPWFWEFLSVLHVMRAQVITLNYDNFVECGVQGLGLQSQGWLGTNTVCEDDILAGLPPAADFPGRATQVGASHSYDGESILDFGRRNNTFQLLKLHGSLSWYWLPESAGNSTIRRWRLPGVFGEIWNTGEDNRDQELPAHEVFIVPPANLKGQRLKEPVMRELWRRAARATATADRIVLMGYSLPAADHSIAGIVSEGIQGRDVKIEIVNPTPSPVEQRLVRLGASSDQIDCVCGPTCVADWTRTEVDRLATEAVRSLRNRQDLLNDEVLLFATAPRLERFRSIEQASDGSGLLHLYLNEAGEQLVKPKMFTDLLPLIASATSLVVEADGRQLPVVGHWVTDKQGSRMTQLHLVVAGR